MQAKKHSSELALSIIIPAHNEAKTLPRSVPGARAAAEQVGVGHEVIVVDDGSDDGTSDVARALGADQVVDVHLRNINGARNAGARAARGDVLCFLDADSQLPAGTLAQGLATLEAGAVACGAELAYDERATDKARRSVARWNRAARRRGWLAATCVFVGRADLRRVGGWDESYFALTGIRLAKQMRQVGRVVLLDGAVITSSRKHRLHGDRAIRRHFMKLLVFRPWRARRREGLDLLYDGRRE